MRNQAQTQQLEITGTTGLSFTFGFQTGSTVSIDGDGDGIPDWWTQKYFGHATGLAADSSRAGDDLANDGLTNFQKYILGLNPLFRAAGTPPTKVSRNASGQTVLQFQTIPDRVYRIYYASGLGGFWTQAGGAITGTGATATWTDDGTQTGGLPSLAATRFYRVEIGLQ